MLLLLIFLSLFESLYTDGGLTGETTVSSLSVADTLRGTSIQLSGRSRVSLAMSSTESSTITLQSGSSLPLYSISSKDDSSLSLSSGDTALMVFSQSSGSLLDSLPQSLDDRFGENIDIHRVSFNTNTRFAFHRVFTLFFFCFFGGYIFDDRSSGGFLIR